MTGQDVRVATHADVAALSSPASLSSTTARSYRFHPLVSEASAPRQFFEAEHTEMPTR
jgi:hypothetical protein